ncbi:hypothetical protein V1478_016868 [Vespula squamosa]|uniref:Uncharacterized protein n=1 Tax=Vespula squamosa TaxID=30214 RepID=A0ABD2A116_VESSQ
MEVASYGRAKGRRRWRRKRREGTRSKEEDGELLGQRSDAPKLLARFVGPGKRIDYTGCTDNRASTKRYRANAVLSEILIYLFRYKFILLFWPSLDDTIVSYLFPLFSFFFSFPFLSFLFFSFLFFSFLYQATVYSAEASLDAHDLIARNFSIARTSK